MTARTFGSSRTTLEDVLASLRRLEAQLEAAEARLAPKPEDPDLAPVRALHRLRDP